MACQGFLKKYYLMQEGGDFFKNTKCLTFTGHHEQPKFAAFFYLKIRILLAYFIRMWLLFINKNRLM